jgi:hypothetical protein
MKPRARLLALPLLALLTPCAGRLPPCPADGGPTWRELTNTRFQLRTDLDEPDARALLPDLERLETGLLTALHAPNGFVPPRLPVVAVARGWTDFTDRNVEGFFTRALFRPLVVFRADGDLRFQDAIKHELAHAFTLAVVPHQPPWLAEGLASYFETLEIDPDRGTVTIGRPPSERLSLLQRLGLSGIEEVMAASEVGENRSGFYATAWITVHYLMNRHAQAFLAYHQQLRAGAPPAAAWSSAFGSLTPAALGAEVRNYLDGGQYELLVFKTPSPAADPITAVTMSDADVHVERALLFAWGDRLRQAPNRSSDTTALVRRELAETMRQDPSHVRGWALRAFALDEPPDPQQARLIAERHGSDWLAWMVLAQALTKNPVGDGARDALARARELARGDTSVALPAP